MDWSRLPGRNTFSPVTPVLALFSVLYGLGVKVRLVSYRRVKRRSLPGFVVSVGNLTVGGTGKTPASCALAQWASTEGYRVAILSRGYGGHYKTKVLEVSDGNDINAGPEQAGDEPFLLAKKLRGVPIILSGKRYLAGLRAHKKFGTNFFILDDGFQHLSLHRDLDLVLLDGANPFGNGHLLPWGPLREPVGELKRAHAYLITRAGQDGSVDGLLEDLRGKFPDKPVYKSMHIPEKIVFPGQGKTYDPQMLKGKRVVACAGIARPGVFKQTLVELGAEVAFFKAFADHHPYKPRDIHELIEQKETLKADYLITTEKDWVRMESLLSLDPDQVYLSVRFNIMEEEQDFFTMVENRVRESGKAK